MAEEDSSTPATRGFWDEFYESGPGKDPYEWYSQTITDFRPIIKPLLHEGDFVLHIGCGNSLLGTELLNDAQLPRTYVLDCDYSLPAVTSLQTRLSQLGAGQGKGKPRFSTLPDIGLLNACALPLPAGRVDLVLDKGCLDAFLSNNQVESGDNPRIFSLFAELARVLRPGGRVLIVSGNDSFIVEPYLYGETEWLFSVTPIKCQKRGGPSTYYVYSLQKPL